MQRIFRRYRDRRRQISSFSGHVPLQLGDHPAGDQIHLRGGAGEIQDTCSQTAAAGRRGARGPPVRRCDTGTRWFHASGCPAPVSRRSAPGRLPRISSSTGISFIRAMRLRWLCVLRHEGTGPGGRILDERPREGDPATVGIADGVGVPESGTPATLSGLRHRHAGPACRRTGSASSPRLPLRRRRRGIRSRPTGRCRSSFPCRAGR